MLAESTEPNEGISARRCVTAAVRVALHALRDSLSYEAAMNVGVRLRGRYRDLYYEDWPSATAVRLASRSEFVQRIGGPDDPEGPGEFLARVALRRVAEETPYPARAEIRGFLPAHLRAFWPVLKVRGRPRRRMIITSDHGHLRLVSESRRAS
jgi:uncharacterized protein (DUF2267 family)